MMRRQMRFAAVLVVVVLALTGFSTSSSGGKSGKSRSGKSSSSGGGCSNSKKSNGSYHHYDDDSDDDYDSSSSSSGGSTYESATPAASASEAPGLRVVRCAQPKKGKRKAYTASSVEIRSTATTEHTYEVDVTFVDAKGLTVDTGEADIDLDAGEKQIISVPMDSPRSVSRVKRCLVTAELRY